MLLRGGGWLAIPLSLSQQAGKGESSHDVVLCQETEKLLCTDKTNLGGNGCKV